MTLAIRCANPSIKIDLRANLAFSNGSVSGTWEERTYNATGNVTGKASPGKLSLAIEGGGLTGRMSISFSGGSQSVSISTQGTGLKGVNLSLSKG